MKKKPFTKFILLLVFAFTGKIANAQFNCLDTAVDLSGTGQYLKLPSNDLTNTNVLSSLDSDYTIECLFKWRGGPDFQRLFDFSYGSDDYFMFLTPSFNNAPRFAISVNGLSSFETVDCNAPFPVDDSFHHIAVTFSKLSSFITIFLDGVNIGSGVVDIGADSIYHGNDSHDSSINYIGLSSFNGDPQLNGVIDEFRISNTMRYTANFTPSFPFINDENTVALYHFNESTGQIAYDSSGNGYDAEFGSTTDVDANDPTRVSCEGTLPVSITTFTGADEKGLVTLKWTTASEVNSNYFEIEKSNDGVHFSTAGTVKGAGVSSLSKNYNFLDIKPFSGNNFYRLKLVDLNGKAAYTKSISVFVGEKNTLKIYPTVTTGKMNVVSKPTIIVIYNVVGSPVKQFNISSANQSIDVSALPAGQYIAKSISTGETLKFIKQ